MALGTQFRNTELVQNFVIYSTSYLVLMSRILDLVTFFILRRTVIMSILAEVSAVTKGNEMHEGSTKRT